MPLVCSSGVGEALKHKKEMSEAIDDDGAAFNERPAVI